MTGVPAGPDADAVPPDGEGGARSGRVRAVVTLLGLAGLAVAVVTTRDDLEGSAIPSWPVLLAGGVLCLVSSLAAARAWSSLVTGADPVEVRGALYLSQLAKYLPAGGIVQATAQVTLTASGGLSTAVTAVSWACSVACTLAAAATVAAGLVLVPDVPAVVRVLALAGLALNVVATPRGLRWGLVTARRFVHRLPAPEHLPSGAALRAAWLWTLGSISAFSTASALVLHDLDPSVGTLAAVPAAAAAWVVGFLAVPVPGGLGVREAVLAGVTTASTAAILASSLAIRLLLLAAEVLTTAGNRLVARRARR